MESNRSNERGRRDIQRGGAVCSEFERTCPPLYRKKKKRKF